VTAPRHTAAPATLGYIYQCEVALLGSLPHALAARDVLTTIEVFDDVAFQFGDGSAREVLQVKHHQQRARDLIDMSADLWRTLGIWSTGIDELRADQYERFALERSLPMFRRRPGCLGALFTAANRGG